MPDYSDLQRVIQALTVLEARVAALEPVQPADAEPQRDAEGNDITPPTAHAQFATLLAVLG